MTEIMHTEGPWDPSLAIGKPCGYYIIDGALGSHTDGIMGEAEFPTMPWQRSGPVDMPPSPDMLEALEALAFHVAATPDDMFVPGYKDALLAPANAAIAKARGENHG